MSFKRILAAAGLAALGVLSLWQTASASMGLRTRFGEVELKNLKIGPTYSMKDLLNFPLQVTNTGTIPLSLAVSVEKPLAGEMKEGFEPIPDTSWVSLQRSSFTVTPGMEAATDVIITVPKDESLLGRRFIVYLWTRSTNAEATGVGLKSRLLLYVSSVKPSDEELKKKFVSKRVTNMNFSVTPMELALKNVKVGESTPVKDGEADVVLINPNPQAYNFRLMSVPVWETAIVVPREYGGPSDASWLKVEGDSVVKMKPYSMTPLKLSVRVPPGEESFKGRGFMLLLRTEILEQDIVTYAYVKIFIMTSK